MINFSLTELRLYTDSMLGELNRWKEKSIEEIKSHGTKLSGPSGW